MNNITYVKTPAFVVNANGKLSDALRPDESKGLRMLTCQTRNFESLKAALAWINKEGQKKSTNLYLYEIRPATQGAYNVRCAIDTVKTVKKQTPNAKVANNTTSNAKTNAKTNARTSARNSNRTSNNNRNSANNNTTNNNAAKTNSNSKSATTRTSANNRSTNSRAKNKA